MAPLSRRFEDHLHDRVLPQKTISWLKHHFVSGAKLMQDDRFNLAFRALDGAHSATTSASAMLLIWSDIEALFRPGKPNTTQRLCSAIASYLEPDIPSRDRLFQTVRSLYEARGQITHAAESPPSAGVCASFILARCCFLKSLEAGEMPNCESLVTQWKART